MKDTLSQAEIKDLRTRRDQIKGSYGQRNALFARYEDIYFMRGVEKPKDPGVDPNDWKVTVSPGGRDKVTGLKRILDTSEIQIKVKDKAEQSGIHANSDKIEAALKTMLKVSGEYKQARNERDTNLAAILYGPVVMSANSLDDLITAKTKTYDGGNLTDKGDGVSKFVRRQLEAIKIRTPFLIDVLNPKESYPEWGRYGLSGHLQEYTMTGMEIKEEWSVDALKFKDNTDYVVQDFFHYDKRLVESNDVTLFAGEVDTEVGIPIFVRLAGGSTLFSKPEEQLNSFLYAYAKGEWDKRENLFWTYLFTAIYTQGLPGPTILRDPDDTSEITVDYRAGVKIITAKGKLENVQVIDGDVIQLKGLMDDQTGRSTIQEQTIGGASDSTTFSGYVMQVNAGKLPATDPKEAQEQVYRDCFLHILRRIKSEGIENSLIDPADIPDNPDLEVTLEPNLQQDDLRNAQIVTQLKQSGANVSDEWLDTNLLKIADSAAMFRQKTKEEFRKAIIANIIENPEIMQQFIMAALSQGQKPPPETPPETAVPPGEETPPGFHMMPNGTMMPDSEMQGQPNMEATPMTDAVAQPQERMMK